MKHASVETNRLPRDHRIEDQSESTVAEATELLGLMEGAQQSRRPVANSPVVVTLQDLHDPTSGRIDAARTAQYLGVPLKQFSRALGRGYSTVHKTPDAPALQPALRSLKRSLTILEEVLGDRSSALAWLNSPHPDLGQRTPLEVILQGYPAAVEEMLESALVGTPS